MRNFKIKGPILKINKNLTVEKFCRMRLLIISPGGIAINLDCKIQYISF